jgi:hypothetical protein
MGALGPNNQPPMFGLPDGPELALLLPPRLESWERAGHPSQVALAEWVAHVGAAIDRLAAGIEGALALRVDLALPRGVDPLWQRDLDNYLFPIARALSPRFASLWVTKGLAEVSTVRVEPACRLAAPPDGWLRFALGPCARGEAALKNAARAAVSDAGELPPGPVGLQIALAVGSADRWSQTWKPLIDGLEPLLGSARREPCWNPQDGRIVRLGIHRTDDAVLGGHVEASIWARVADPAWQELAWLRAMSTEERAAYMDAHRARLDQAREAAVKPRAVRARDASGESPATRTPGARATARPHQDEAGVFVFTDDDPSYLRWIATNPNGRVLNAARSLTVTPTLHRATCHTIGGTPTHGRIWTGPYIKACSADMAALLRWCEANVARAPRPCGVCAP